MGCCCSGADDNFDYDHRTHTPPSCSPACLLACLLMRLLLALGAVLMADRSKRSMAKTDEKGKDCGPIFRNSKFHDKLVEYPPEASTIWAAFRSAHAPRPLSSFALCSFADPLPGEEPPTRTDLASEPASSTSGRTRASSAASTSGSPTETSKKRSARSSPLPSTLCPFLHSDRLLRLQALEIAAGLLAIGAKELDNIGICSANRAEWTISSLALQFLRCRTVALYDTLGSPALPLPLSFFLSCSVRFF